METGKSLEKKADFQKRTFDYALRVVRLSESLPKSEADSILGKQLLRFGTSVGANSRAARRSLSRAEFISKRGLGRHSFLHQNRPLEKITQRDGIPSDFPSLNSDFP